MEKEKIQKTLKIIRDNSTKRNFKQTIDLIINLMGLDLKKQDNRVDTFAQLHYPRGKKIKICGLVGPELLESAKSNFDTVISVDDFSKYADKKKLKKLAKEHTFFVAQANIMPKVATTFGRSLGPLGKMPNPKAGCVVPPNANLQPLVEKLQKTVKIKIETNPLFQTYVGQEDTPDNELIDNILAIYNTLMHSLPGEVHNIKNVYLKLTMGKAYGVVEKLKEEPTEKKEQPEKEAPKGKSEEKAKENPAEKKEKSPEEKKPAKKAQTKEKKKASKEAPKEKTE